MGKAWVKVGFMAFLTGSVCSPPLSWPSPASALFAGLEHEWRKVASCQAARAVMAGLAEGEPDLAQCQSLADAVAIVSWHGRSPSPVGACVMSALLRQARSPLVDRALLQALLPRIRAERVASPVYGHRCGDYAQSPADTMGDLVAECYAAITRHAGEDHADVARLILQEATRRLRTARQADRRYRQRTVQLEGDVPWPRSAPQADRHHIADLWSARTAVEWLAEAVVEAVRRGRLSVGEARLVYGARVRGLHASELGRQEGLPGRSVYYALSQAELALISAASRDLRLVVAVGTPLGPRASQLGACTKVASRGTREAA